MLLEELDDLSKKWAKLKDDKFPPYADQSRIPLVICGDFNSTPESGVYEYMAKGKIDSNHTDFQSHRYGKFTEVGMTHPFSLKSAYAMKDGKELLPFTNYTPGFQGVIDYIWYGTGALTVEAVMDRPEDEYIENVVGFPDPHFPSEYTPLNARLMTAILLFRQNCV